MFNYVNKVEVNINLKTVSSLYLFLESMFDIVCNLLVLTTARALNTIFQKWNIEADQTQWNISGNPCTGAAIDSSDIDNSPVNPLIKCDCTAVGNDSTCHITRL